MNCPSESSPTARQENPCRVPGRAAVRDTPPDASEGRPVLVYRDGVLGMRNVDVEVRVIERMLPFIREVEGLALLFRRIAGDLEVEFHVRPDVDGESGQCGDGYQRGICGSKAVQSMRKRIASRSRVCRRNFWRKVAFSSLREEVNW